jgi:hypothetical protein
MAKDYRKIHSGVRHKGTTYTEGMEDELASAVSASELKRLSDRGAISGNWQSSAVEAEEAETEDELTDDETEESEDDEVDLQSMTIAELKNHAAELGVELTATKKAGIISEIEAAG